MESARRIPDHELVRLPLDVGSCRFDRRVDERIDRHLFPVQLELAAVDATHVEQVVDQPGHHPELAIHHGIDIRRPSGYAQLQDGDAVANGCERITQLVRQRRQKQAFDGIGPLQIRRALLQLEGHLLEHLLRATIVITRLAHGLAETDDQGARQRVHRQPQDRREATGHRETRRLAEEHRRSHEAGDRRRQRGTPTSHPHGHCDRTKQGRVG